MSRIANALDEWRAVLGAAAVVTPTEGLRAVDGSTRQVPAVLQPANVPHVQAAVRVAARHGVRLHAVSTGRNWGLGSALPVEDSCAILRLDRLDRLREFNRNLGYAVVEPGVTQGQLFRETRDSGWVVNVTGSSADTSVLGNALDRGMGYFAGRADALTALEVVTGTGDILRTGFGAIPGAKTAHLFRHGVGPSLDGLFFQSSFGVVTAAGFALMRAWEQPAAFTLRLHEEARLGDLVDRLAELRAQGTLRTIAHLGNAARTRITLAPLLAEQMPWLDPAGVESFLNHQGYGWSVVAGIGGPRVMVDASVRQIKAALGRLGRFRLFTPEVFARAERVLPRLGRWFGAHRQLAHIRAMRPLAGFSWGEPNDAALGGVFWPIPRERGEWRGRDPDASTVGLIYILPILPARGVEAVPAVSHAESFLRARGFEPAITLNVMDERALEAVISVPFDRVVPAQAPSARDAMRELEDWFIRAGFPPYRVGLHTRGRLFDSASPYAVSLRDLKRLFDPANVFAPGRYDP